MTMANRMNVDDVMTAISRTVTNVERSLTTEMDTERKSELCRSVTAAISNLERIADLIDATEKNNLAKSLTDMLCLLRASDGDARENSGFQGEREKTGHVGRPSVVITEEQLRLLQEKGFSAKNMAHHFSCSLSLIYGKLKDYNMPQRKKYSTIDDDALDVIVARLHSEYPNAGTKLMCGYLRTEGHFLQRQRVRESLARVDGASAAQRWSRSISRRIYSVASPNSLWHMDGHMKLIRWGFTTHGCIDGFSRLIVFLAASTNNKATTVFSAFLEATIQYGLPSRVRSDHGGENKHVALFMNLMRGVQRGSHITGRSVHNQRIERLWRDVFTQVIDFFYTRFYRLEDEGKLDINQENDIVALHAVYLPEINRKLEVFQKAWNNHSIRTEHNRSPEQLWIGGLLNRMHTENAGVNSVFADDQSLEILLRQGLEHYGLQLDQFDQLNDQPDNNEITIPGLEQILETEETLERKFHLAKSALQS